MMKYIPKEAKVILEVGCGQGNFAYALKQQRQGSEVWGLELAEDEAAEAAQKLDKVLSGSVESQIPKLPENHFEVVIFNDVLEHLLDPYTILQQLKAKLKPGGIVVSSIPNIRYFRNLFDFVWRKNWDYTDNGIMDKTHFRFFTVNSIRKMYEGQGYKVLTHEGINATKSIKPLLFNILFLGKFSDIKYLQFATVAQFAE
ncbi:MAG TPA: class I SAM-dependent methyltransferase [Microscillaceae bacterium]|nr:class I SAM-dependent methyltransferase [Microscillaceae bacterium]